MCVSVGKKRKESQANVNLKSDKQMFEEKKCKFRRKIVSVWRQGGWVACVPLFTTEFTWPTALFTGEGGLEIEIEIERERERKKRERKRERER